MSAKCQWCHRKRPEVVMDVDGREMHICTNCKHVIQDQARAYETEIAKNRAARHGNAQ